MNISIPYKDNLEKMVFYTNILNPVFKLKPKERLALAVLLANYLSNKHLTDEEISKIMFNSSVRKEMRESIKMSEASFNNMFTIFRKKDILLGDRINPKITKVLPTQDNFSLTFNFKHEQGN